MRKHQNFKKVVIILENEIIMDKDMEEECWCEIMEVKNKDNGNMINLKDVEE